ncbi:MAG: hypothetical protein K2H64_04720 [Desulfovibrio sp.]|nr:hypothetical protein [Desulfovibrio sp.]
MGKKLGFGGRPVDGEKAGEERREPFILPFDNGDGLTAGDLNHHVIIFGATGSGKTTNCLLPAAHRLIAEGHCVIILAVKDSLADYALKLAKLCGREKDVRLRGTTPGSERMNLLAGRTDSEIYEIFDDMTFSMMRGMSHNYDFHVKGFAQTVDCCFLLRKIGKLLPSVTVTPQLVCEMIHDSYSSTSLWKFYRDFVFDAASKEEVRFRKAIESNPFHLFNEPQTDEERKRTPPSRYEQMNYQMGQIRTTLRNFVEVPGIIKYFSDPAGPGLDMNPTVRDNLIDIIQFDPECGPAAASLGRVLLTHIYKAIIKHGKSLPPGRKVCVIIDEFQSVADLSAKRYSDSSFASLAREFNGVLLAATQSMAALASKGDNIGEVESLVSNCNANIFFYTADSFTQAKARQHDDHIVLADLKPGEAFVAHYNNDTREHASGIRTFQGAYENTKALLDSMPAPERDDGAAPEHLSLIDILDLAEARKALIEKEKDRKRTAIIMERKNKKMESMPEAGSPNKKTRRPAMDDEDIFPDIPAFAGPAPDIHEPAANGKSDRHPLAAAFPEFFANDANIEIPKGWRQIAERAMLVFSKLGLPVVITALYPRYGALYAECKSERFERQKKSGESILNSLLKYAGDYCMLCGNPLNRRPGGEDDEQASATLCNKCLTKYGLGGKGEQE